MIPEQLPLLRPGAHLAAEDGACLMEFVSLLAGESFSDCPSCTDPTLAVVARLVNDATSDDARPALAFAPALTVARGRERKLAPAVVVAVLTVVSPAQPATRALRGIWLEGVAAFNIAVGGGLLRLLGGSATSLSPGGGPTRSGRGDSCDPRSADART